MVVSHGVVGVVTRDLGSRSPGRTGKNRRARHHRQVAVRVLSFGLATVRRQSGQVVWDANHMLTHSAWTSWPQHGRNRASSPSSSSERHTMHSTAAPSSSDEPVVAARYTVTGSERGTSGSTPCSSKPYRRRCCLLSGARAT
nr:unnamed protein product [Digitaria exilis]